MATRRKKKTTKPTAVAVDDDEREEDAPEDEGAHELERVLTEMGARAYRIQLWHRNPSGKWIYVAQVSPEDFSLEQVRQTYGGGRYQGRFWDESNEYIGKEDFEIDKRAVAPVEPGARDDQQGTPAFAMAMAMRDMVEEIRSMKSEPAQATDPMALALQIATLVSNSSAAMMTAFASVQPKPAAQSGFKDMLEVLNQGIDLGSKMEGDGFGTAIAQLVKPLADLAERQKKPAGTETPALAGGEPTSPTTEDVDKDRPVWYTVMKPWFGQLLGLAKKDANPEVWALSLLDLLSESDVAFLRDALLDPSKDFAGELYRHVPQAIPLRPWFDELIEALKVQLQEDALEAEVIDITDEQEGKNRPSSPGVTSD